MKRSMPVLTAAAGVLAATLTGISPASAAPSSAPAVDCSTGGYTRVLHSYIPTNDQRPAVDGRSYDLSGPQANTYEICLDIPATSTFTIEVRIYPGDGSTKVFRDDRPGDKVFRYSPGASSFWQVFGTLTGPDSTYLYYDWYEKQIPV